MVSEHRARGYDELWLANTFSLMTISNFLVAIPSGMPRARSVEAFGFECDPLILSIVSFRPVCASLRAFDSCGGAEVECCGGAEVECSTLQHTSWSAGAIAQCCVEPAVALSGMRVNRWQL